MLMAFGFTRAQKPDITMHRLTARLLLVLLLVGTFAPVALALTAPPPHECCLRKPLHDHGSMSFAVRTTGRDHQNCCPPVTTAQWAELGSYITARTHLSSAPLQADLTPVQRSNPADTFHSGRAPPLG
jgi:hypothetical protein